MESSASVISPEDVLESLMNDGTIDALRLKIINQLKANVRKASSVFPSGLLSFPLLRFLFFLFVIYWVI